MRLIIITPCLTECCICEFNATCYASFNSKCGEKGKRRPALQTNKDIKLFTLAQVTRLLKYIILIILSETGMKSNVLVYLGGKCIFVV